MSRWRVAPLLVLLFALACAAQDVPPPPKPDTVDPALAPLLESLKQALLSSGRVEFSYVIGNATIRIWQQVTSVTVDAPGCQARIHYEQSISGQDLTDRAMSLFFESLNTVDAFTQQEAHDRYRSRLGQSRYATYSGAFYVLVINNGNRQEINRDSVSDNLLFASEAEANRSAELMKRASQICRAPLSLNVAAGAPSLVETLHFIEGKLNDYGAVNYRKTDESPNGSAYGNPSSYSVRLTQAAADSSTCLMSMNDKVTINGSATNDDRKVISFRRVEKIDVATSQDIVNRARARKGISLVAKTEPVVFELLLTYLGGESLALCFPDEEIANRIAKAMNHAVELCGGGSKDPF